jgi:6-pyruvoyltetrahydropterin/6-carboxytetrahydropterin synthase
MIIRKLFSFEGAHVVRNCSTQRCAWSIHGHSYRVEILLEADALDHGQMVYDFGLMKTGMRDVVDAFDHTLVYWQADDVDYISACRQHSQRWIGLPVSPSAEQLSRVFFVLIDRVLQDTKMHNGEASIALHSIILHETATGYAQCFAKDAYNPRMGIIEPHEIMLSTQVQSESNLNFYSVGVNQRGSHEKNI